MRKGLHVIYSIPWLGRPVKIHWWAGWEPWEPLILAELILGSVELNSAGSLQAPHIYFVGPPAWLPTPLTVRSSSGPGQVWYWVPAWHSEVDWQWHADAILSLPLQRSYFGPIKSSGGRELFLEWTFFGPTRSRSVWEASTIALFAIWHLHGSLLPWKLPAAAAGNALFATAQPLKIWG